MASISTKAPCCNLPALYGFFLPCLPQDLDSTEKFPLDFERIGLIPHVPRKENGIRDFDEAACGWVEFSNRNITHL